MSIVRLCIASCALALVASLSWAAGPAPPPREDPSVIKTGREIFHAKGCYQCHGLVGQGSIISGPALSPFSMPLATMRHYVRNPKGVMPAYSRALLPDSEVAAIRAFLVSLPPPRDPATVPALALLVRTSAPAPASASAPPLAGGALFQRHCAVCHGARLEGGVGPALAEAGRKLDVAAIEKILRDPPPPMPHLYPATIDAAAVHAIATYVQAYPAGRK